MRGELVHFTIPGFVNEKKQTLRDILTGDQYLSSPYKLEFLVNEDSEVVCEKNLTKEEVLKFQDAVAKDYYIQMYCDDMPIWTFIGRMDTKRKDIFSTWILISAYITIRNIWSRSLLELTFLIVRNWLRKGKFTWKWNILWHGRKLAAFLRKGWKSTLVIPQEICWFSILNSCVTILFLNGQISMYYLWILKKDLE